MWQQPAEGPERPGPVDMATAWRPAYPEGRHAAWRPASSGPALVTSCCLRLSSVLAAGPFGIVSPALCSSTFRQLAGVSQHCLLPGCVLQRVVTGCSGRHVHDFVVGSAASRSCTIRHASARLFNQCYCGDSHQVAIRSRADGASLRGTLAAAHRRAAKPAETHSVESYEDTMIRLLRVDLVATAWCQTASMLT